MLGATAVPAASIFPASASARRAISGPQNLVARRSLVDPNFAETVILLVQHDDEAPRG